ncbi:MAG TPA: hydrolase [Planctomycetota bacterium]|nr:hydrolase [Planctomycetota bacterium]
MDPRHPDLADASRSTLVVVDVQEKLFGVIHDAAHVEAALVKAIRGAAALRVKTLVTEQYPAGLGPTVAAVREAASGAVRVEKICFSCGDEPRFIETLRESDRDTVALVGIEAHVCVLQTAFDLLARGYRVHVAADATGSRHDANRRIALRRMARAGAQITCVESLLFEWTREAKGDRFKAISKLVK